MSEWTHDAEVMPKGYTNGYASGYEDGYADGIDDFVEALDRHIHAWFSDDLEIQDHIHQVAKQMESKR